MMERIAQLAQRMEWLESLGETSKNQGSMCHERAQPPGVSLWFATTVGRWATSTVEEARKQDGPGVNGHTLEGHVKANSFKASATLDTHLSAWDQVR